MLIRAMNALLLLSAGFFLGHLYAPSREASVVPKKVISAPAPRHESHRLDTSASQAPTQKSGRSPASVAAPVDLAAYLERFAMVDVHDACAYARERFIEKNIASQAAFIMDLNNADEHQTFINHHGRRLAAENQFWLGRSELDLGDQKIFLEVIMDAQSFSADARERGQGACWRTRLRAVLPSGGEFSHAFDACNDVIVSKSGHYFVNFESFAEPEINRFLAVLQIPLPGLDDAPLEVMRSSDQAWSRAEDFHWQSVAHDEGLRLISAPARMALNRGGS